MSYDELELDRMGDRRTATFFCISDTDSTYNFLVALAFSQMFNLLCERADNVHGGTAAPSCAGTVGRGGQYGTGAPDLKSWWPSSAPVRSACACYISSWPNARPSTIRTRKPSSATWIVCCSSADAKARTIKEISENWLGKATISMQTEGRSRGQSESYSQNTQRLGRELMTPSELATMPGDRCILQLRGPAAVLLQEV